MKKIVLLSLLSFFSSGYLFGQILPDEMNSLIPFESKSEFRFHKPHLDKIQEEMTELDYFDVIKYELAVDWTRPFEVKNLKTENVFYKGINKITFRSMKPGLDAIYIHYVGLQIDSVKQNNSKLSYNVTAGDLLKINLSAAMNSGDTSRVDVYYTYNYAPTDYKGFFVFDSAEVSDFFYINDSTTVTTFNEARIAYTMSEPQDARKWMPCKDVPNDKAFFQAAIKLPKGFIGISNGKLIKTNSWQEESGREGFEYVWSCEKPMSTYLMVLNASKFEKLDDIYIPENKSLKPVPITNFMWAADTGSTSPYYKGRQALKTVPDMMKVLSDFLVPYPFETYGHVAVAPFNFGGMEHQTMTTIHRSWLMGTAEGGVAHELGHHWLGDLVTCKDWKEIWFNEGGATYTEQLWSEKAYDDTLFNVMNRYSSLYIRDFYRYNLGSIKSLQPYELFSRNTTHLVYWKAGWIYHMLRFNLGDEKFFEGMKNVFTDYAYSNIDTEGFINSFKKVPGVDADFLQKFMTQWLEGVGHPKFHIDWSMHPQDSGKYLVKVRLNQFQQTEPQVYETKIKMVIRSSDALNIRNAYDMYVDEKNEYAEYIVDFKPEMCYVSRAFTLCEVEQNFVSVEESPEVAGIVAAVYPNPAVQGSRVYQYLKLNEQSILKIELFDNFGLKAGDIYEGELIAGSYQFDIKTDELSSGAYFVRILINGRPLISRFTLSK